MANYDSAGNKVKRNYHIPLWMMLIGAIITTIGIIWCANTNWDKYLKLESFSETYDSSPITDCDISFSTGESTIVKSSDNQIHLTADNVPAGIYSYGVDGDRFYLKVNKHNINFTNWLQFVRIGDSVTFDNLKITIELPDKIYNKVKIDNGVGQLNISDIKSRKATVDNGVGELNISDCTFEKIDVDNGVGSTQFNNVFFGDTSIDNGVGEVKFTGHLNGDLEIDNGVGSCDFILFACRDDFEIERNSESNISISGKGTQSSSHSYKIDAESGVGDIDIQFADIA